MDGLEGNIPLKKMMYGTPILGFFNKHEEAWFNVDDKHCDYWQRDMMFDIWNLTVILSI